MSENISENSEPGYIWSSIKFVNIANLYFGFSIHTLKCSMRNSWPPLFYPFFLYNTFSQEIASHRKDSCMGLNRQSISTDKGHIKCIFMNLCAPSSYHSYEMFFFAKGFPCDNCEKYLMEVKSSELYQCVIIKFFFLCCIFSFQSNIILPSSHIQHWSCQ